MVYLYKNSDEFCSIIEGIRKGSLKKYSDKQRKEFLDNNSWNNRMTVITEIIDKMENRDK